MRSVSSAFLRALSAGRSDYALRAVITLTDSTALTLENEEIWDGGFSVEDAVSNDNSFDVGAAIINQAKLVINNIYEDYDAYDFDGAQVVMYAGFANLDDGTSPYLRMGTFTVDETSYDGSIITLTCLDNMAKFDRPYTFDQTGDQTLTYPATLGEIVRNACHNCGVTLANNSQQFNRYTYQVTEKPDGESTTYRQVISWAAQIAGSFARCNANGQLEIKWYNVSAIDSDDDDLDGGTFDNGSPQYSSGDTADGGTFNPWNTGYVYDAGEFSTARTVHYITSDYSSKISTDNVVITGVKVRKKLKDDTSGDGYVEYTSGTAGYMVGIEDNDLIQGTHGQDIADALGLELIGLSFRKADITHPSDPTIEAGDVAFFWDRKGRKYPIIISSTTFTAGNSQHTTSSAETPKKNSMQRFTAETQNYVAFRQQMAKQKTEWEEAVSDLAEALAASGGLYCHEVPQPGGGSKIYYHNKPSLAASDIQMVFTDVGFTLSNDGGQTWYGMTVDGTFIASVINTIGLFFDYAHGGTLTLGGSGNVNGQLRVLDANGNQIGSWNYEGLKATGELEMTYYAEAPAANRQDANLKLNFGSYELIFDDGGDLIAAEDMAGICLSKVGESEYNKLYLCNYDFPFNDESSTSGWNYIRSKCKLWIQADAPGYNMNPSPYFMRLPGNGIFMDGTRGSVALNYSHLTLAHTNGVVCTGNLSVTGDLSVTGLKPRLVTTEDYAKRYLYCYETPSPLFGDVGEGTIADDGKCYVYLDAVFAETINTNQYQVFLQAYDSGSCWVSERHPGYFVVEGTPGLSFGWELKAKQLDFDQKRLDMDIEPVEKEEETNYGLQASLHISDLRKEREGTEE